MKNESLNVLCHLIREKSARQERLTELIKDPEKNHDDNWFIYVPTCFNEALDIKQTERVENGEKIMRWTQGSSFSFKPGDTLYDTPHAYEAWSEGLKHLNLCVQIKQATNAGPAESNKSRVSGSVAFSILIPNKTKTQLSTQSEYVTMTQDEFVRFLISGPDAKLEEKIKKLSNFDLPGISAESR